MRNLFHFGATVDLRKEDGKFVASESGQHIGATELVLHAVGDFLKIKVSDLVSVNIVHLFKVVKVDVHQSKDGCILTRALDLSFQVALEREPIVNVGEEIKLRASD